MTAEEYYQNWIDQHSVDINGMASLTRSEVIAMIEGYHQQQVKNCDLADVSGSSLPLKIERVVVVAAQRWGKDYPGSTVGIIGRDAIEICKQYDIDWENYR